MVADAGVPERIVWRASSTIALLLNWTTAHVILRYTVRHRISAPRSLALVVLYPTEVIGEIALLVNVFGLHSDYASTLYLVFLLAGLAQATAAFVYFLGAIFAPESR